MELEFLHWLALAGIFFSMYFLYVKEKHQKNRWYKPLCDITPFISCTKAAQTKESNLFVFPNAFYGVMFYVVVFGLATLQQYFLVFSFAIVSSFFSIYLMYLSWRIKVLCPVCLLIYVINFLMLYYSYALL